MPGLTADGRPSPFHDAAVALDANALQPSGTDRDELVGRFRDLMRAGAVKVVMLESVGRELDDARTPAEARPETPAGAGIARRAPTAAQQIARIRVRAIMRGNALNDRHDADAAHLCEAAEAGCRIFLTHDKRFSRKRHDLEAALPGLRILGLREFFALYDAPAAQAE